MVIVPPCWPPPEFDAVVDVPPFDDPPLPQPTIARAAHTAADDPINLLLFLLTSHSSSGFLPVKWANDNVLERPGLYAVDEGL
jgi:hypothetical protein